MSARWASDEPVSEGLEAAYASQADQLSETLNMERRATSKVIAIERLVRVSLASAIRRTARAWAKWRESTLAAELAEAREAARERTEIAANAQDGLRVARHELRRVREDKQRMEEELRRLRAEVLVLHEERAQEMHRHVATLGGRRQQRGRRAGRGGAAPRGKQPAVPTGGNAGRREVGRSLGRDAPAGQALVSYRDGAALAQAPRPSPLGPRRQRARPASAVMGRAVSARRSSQELLRLFRRVAWSVGRARCRQLRRRARSHGQRSGGRGGGAARLDRVEAPQTPPSAALTKARHGEAQGEEVLSPFSRYSAARSSRTRTPPPKAPPFRGEDAFVVRARAVRGRRRARGGGGLKGGRDGEGRTRASQQAAKQRPGAKPDKKSAVASAKLADVQRRSLRAQWEEARQYLAEHETSLGRLFAEFASRDLFAVSGSPAGAQRQSSSAGVASAMCMHETDWLALLRARGVIPKLIPRRAGVAALIHFAQLRGQTEKDADTLARGMSVSARDQAFFLTFSAFPDALILLARTCSAKNAMCSCLRDCVVLLLMRLNPSGALFPGVEGDFARLSSGLAPPPASPVVEQVLRGDAVFATALLRYRPPTSYAAERSITARVSLSPSAARPRASPSASPSPSPSTRRRPQSGSGGSARRRHPRGGTAGPPGPDTEVTFTTAGPAPELESRVPWATDVELCRLWDIAAYYCTLGSYPTMYLTSSQFHRVILRARLVGRRDPPAADGKGRNPVLEYGAVELIYNSAVRGDSGDADEGFSGTPPSSSRRDLGPASPRGSPRTPGRRAGGGMAFPHLMRAVHLVAARLAPWATEETLDAQRRRVLLAILRHHGHIASRRDTGPAVDGAQKEARPRDGATEAAPGTETMADALEYPSFATLTTDPTLDGDQGEGLHLGAPPPPSEPGMYADAATPGERVSSLWDVGSRSGRRRSRQRSDGARRHTPLSKRVAEEEEEEGEEVGANGGWDVPPSRAVAATPPPPWQ